ncbi:MAG TPA: nitronate monooxygenase [Anaerolineales bacterium]|jgi:dihydroorotate dehydrogenase (NAD+) catalytic subunit|nr:nitronate monooxygenase [Anaerolineales bacterium]
MKTAPDTEPAGALDLAPEHKRGFPLKSPLLAASGCWGFANEYANLIEMSLLGALITNPISRRPRRPAGGAHARSVAGGVALHTGLPNPGLSVALRRFAPKWRRMPCAVIVHLALHDAGEARKCVERLEDVENVLAIELGFRHDEDARAAAATVATAAQGLLPVVVQVPFSRTAEFSALAEQAGAQAVSVSAPPRAALTAAEGWFEGRMYGGGLCARTVQVVRELRRETDLPIIAAGGVHSAEQINALLSAGARAVQLESVVWIDAPNVNAMLQSWKH